MNPNDPVMAIKFFCDSKGTILRTSTYIHSTYSFFLTLVTALTSQLLYFSALDRNVNRCRNICEVVKSSIMVVIRRQKIDVQNGKTILVRWLDNLYPVKHLHAFIYLWIVCKVEQIKCVLHYLSYASQASYILSKTFDWF